MAAAVLATPATAHAKEVAVATPAGSAVEVAIVLARQTGTSIVIVDPQLARRRIGALRGRMAPVEAVRRLARAAGGRALSAAPGAWRIEAAAPARAAAAKPSRIEAADRAPEAVDAELIVVVGSKRELTLAKVPGQVSIINGRALEVGGTGGTEKIAQRIPTVSSTHLGSGRNKLFIRGIADSSFTGPTQATVGQYLGDLRLTYNAPDPDLRLSDMAQVEVLEGPQGTLYGAGSLGGIIRLVPNPPVLGEASAAVALGGALTQEGAPGGDAGATVNLPASTAVALRATIDAATLGGYIDKPRLGQDDVNRTRILGGRISLRAELAPEWTVDILGLGQSTRARDSQYAARGGSPLVSEAQVREGSNADYAMGQFIISGQLSGLGLRSTTGVVRQDLEERYDASLGDMPRLFTQENRTRMIAHETRLWAPERNGFGWLVGASFIHNRTVLTRGFEAEGLRSSTTGVRNTIDEATLYAQASLRLREGLTATAGARLTHSRLGGAAQDVAHDVAPALALARAAVTADQTVSTALPSLAVNAQVSPTATLYMRYEQGFRPGGLTMESDFVRRFRNDRTSTWELGLRHSRTGSGPFHVTASVSFTRWRDIQADFIDNAGLPSTANIGNGRVWSASVTGGIEIVRGLRAEAGVAWNNSEVDTPTSELLTLVARAMPVPVSSAQAYDAVLARSMQVPNIAEVSGRAALSWNRELGRSLRLSSNLWASYVGKSRLGIGPELGELQGDYIDSSADVRLGTEAYGLTLSISNIANSRGNRFSLGTPFATVRDQVTPLRPRTVRIGLDAKF
ncbi:TonB-dependent receptor [Novosphingobium sp. RD2P27]|uniref:TonB-dependent receptor n=1 Tax=Novosphingobium kalidii TaxID=3230299 RepID=A0ABV2CWL6_9SPHN